MCDQKIVYFTFSIFQYQAMLNLVNAIDGISQIVFPLKVSAKK